jgi:integrase/recombinase XerD
MLGCVMDDERGEMARAFAVRRVRMPSSGVESWTVVGLDGRPVGLVDEFLAWLTAIERSPNTVEAYARDLGLFWSFLDERELVWDRVSVAELGEFAAWARRPRRAPKPAMSDT